MFMCASQAESLPKNLSSHIPQTVNSLFLLLPQAGSFLEVSFPLLLLLG